MIHICTVVAKSTTPAVCYCEDMADADDDFEDFGGFEAAEPVLPDEVLPVAQGLEAGPSPWAILPDTTQAVGVSSSQPDLIQSRATPPHPSLEPPFPPNEAHRSSSDTSGLAVSRGTDGGAAAASFGDVDLQFDAVFSAQRGAPQVRSFSEQVLEPQFGDAAGPADKPIPAGVLDLDLSRKDADVHVNGGIAPQASGISREGEQVGAMPLDGAGVAAEAPPCAQHENNEAAERLSLVEMEKLQIEKELQTMANRHAELARQLQESSQQQKEQSEQYKALQLKHEAEIEELRKAGHDAVAVIVEEYKELCRGTVSEQLATAEKKLVDLLEEERGKCQKLLLDQQERLCRQMDEERENMEKKIADVLETQTKLQEEKVKVAVKEEQERCQEQIKIAIQAVKDDHKKAMEEVLQAERQKATQLLKDETQRLMVLVEEEREQSKRAVEEAVEHERSQCKECLREAVKEEAERGEETRRQALDLTRSEMKTYVEEQRQADLVSRRRALLTTDLFLESARKQIQTLLDSNDQHPSDS